LSKFRIKLKLTGLEIEVEGTREDVPLLAKQIGAQLGSLVAPAAAMADGKALGHQREPIDITPPREAQTGSAGKVRRPARRGGGGGESAVAVEFNHSVESYGSPLQAWNTAKKSMWLLYVSDKQGGPKEMSAAQIATTFNKRFKQAGMIRPENVSRDLGRLKTKAPAKASDDTTKDPAVWFLTETGTKDAEALVAAARGGEAGGEA
jgi:hypothetical protein